MQMHFRCACCLRIFQDQERHISSLREPRLISMVKILGALDRIESQLSNAPRTKSISHFLASISSFEIMHFSEILTFLCKNVANSEKEEISIKDIGWYEASWGVLKGWDTIRSASCCYFSVIQVIRHYFYRSPNFMKAIMTNRNLGVKLQIFSSS